MTFHAGKRKKEWAFAQEMAITTASQICALLTMCSCLLLQRSSFKKCCATSKIAQKRWDSRYVQEKTKILSSQSSNSRKEIEIDNIKVEISTREESTKYLGQMVTFQQQEMTETAWATFYKYKQGLTSKSYLLRHRLRLFDMVVTPTMNYASGTRTLSKEHERMIQSTERKILRLIIQTKRKYKKKAQG